VSIGLSAADAQTLQAYHSLSLSLSVAGRAGPIELFTIRIFGLLILPDYFNIDTWSLQNDNMDERFPRFWFEPVEHTAAADRAYQSKTLIKAVFTCTAYMYHSVNIHRTCRPYVVHVRRTYRVYVHVRQCKHYSEHVHHTVRRTCMPCMYHIV